MRTLPAIPSTTTTSISEKQPSFDTDSYQQKADIDIRTFSKDVDSRQVPFTTTMSSSMDTDIRQNPFEDSHDSDSNSREDKSQSAAPNFELPQATRDLLARITATQKDNTVDAPSTVDSQHMSNVQSVSFI